MYLRLHGFTKAPERPTSKYRRIAQTGVNVIAMDTEGDWEITISHRLVGTTIRRDQFSATIRRENPEHEEFLTGFGSRQTAMTAARKRIDILSSISGKIIRADQLRHRARPMAEPNFPTQQGRVDRQAEK